MIRKVKDFLSSESLGAFLIGCNIGLSLMIAVRIYRDFDLIMEYLEWKIFLLGY